MGANHLRILETNGSGSSFRHRWGASEGLKSSLAPCAGRMTRRQNPKARRIPSQSLSQWSRKDVVSVRSGGGHRRRQAQGPPRGRIYRPWRSMEPDKGRFRHLNGALRAMPWMKTRNHKLFCPNQQLPESKTALTIGKCRTNIDEAPGYAKGCAGHHVWAISCELLHHSVQKVTVYNFMEVYFTYKIYPLRIYNTMIFS